MNTKKYKTVRFQDIIKTKNKIPGRIMAYYDAPTSEDSNKIFIPKNFLLTFIGNCQFDFGDGKGDYLEFIPCISYQLQFIVEKYNIVSDGEKNFSHFTISIAKSELIDNYEIIVPFSKKYLSPYIGTHIVYVAKDYTSKKQLPDSVTKKFYNDESEIKNIMKYFEDDLTIWSETFNQILTVMSKQSKELIGEKRNR